MSRRRNINSRGAGRLARLGLVASLRLCCAGKPEEETDRQALIQNDHALELMEVALKELGAEQQQCVTLFYLEKKSYQQISDETGYNMLQVKSFIQNGKRNLKLLIEKKMKQK